MVRGPISTRGESKRADYIRYYKDGITAAQITASAMLYASLREISAA